MSKLTGFALALWQSAEKEFVSRVIQSSFFQGLCSGKLPKKEFFNFLYLDIAYLSAFAKAMAHLHKKVNSEHQSHFARFIEETKLEEKRLRALLNRANHITEIKRKIWDQYAEHLIVTTEKNTHFEGIAATFPCFLFFYQMGKYFKTFPVAGSNPYADWIAIYAPKEYGSNFFEMMSIVNFYAAAADEETRKKMRCSFSTSAFFEMRLFIGLNSCEMTFWEEDANERSDVDAVCFQLGTESGTKRGSAHRCRFDLS